jgi:periplasmic divalent cation tolerance protein
LSKFCIIKTTFPSKKEAKNFATKLLGNSLAACIHIKKINSYYTWQGKIENQKEYLLEIKTKTSLYKEIEKFILQNHPYEVPEIILIPIKKGFAKYLEWIENETL